MTSSSLPEADVDRVRLWCEARVPKELRDRVRLECAAEPRSVTIVERYPRHPEDPDGDWTRTVVARLRYTKASGLWSLYWPDRDSAFHEYDGLRPSRRVTDLLREVERDPTGIFWG